MSRLRPTVLLAVGMLLVSGAVHGQPFCPYGREIEDNTCRVDEVWDFLCVRLNSDSYGGTDDCLEGWTIADDWPLTCEASELFWETADYSNYYNCYAFTTGCVTSGCWADPDLDIPTDSNGDMDGCVEISESDNYYADNGWTATTNYYRECDKRKICALGDRVYDDGLYKTCLHHAIAEVCNGGASGGYWESKLGETWQLMQDRWALVGPQYGGYVRCYEKAVSGANPDACDPGYDPTTDPINIPSFNCSASPWYYLNPLICSSPDPTGPLYTDPVIPGICPVCALSPTPCEKLLSNPANYLHTHSDLAQAGAIDARVWVRNRDLSYVTRYDGMSNSYTSLLDEFGSAIATFPDKNGDGIGEAAIGIPGYGGGRGRVIIMGTNNGTVLRTIDGPTATSKFGASLLWHGGYLAIGAPGAGTNGVVYLYNSSYALMRTVSTTSSTVVRFGEFLAPGPVAGSLPTYLIGAPSSTPGGITRAGSLLRYNTNGVLISRFDGTKPSGKLGFAAASNATHILIGSPFSTEGINARAGAVFLFTTGGTQVWKVAGTSAQQNLGASVAGGMNLDAVPGMDWVIGSPGTDIALVVNANGSTTATYTSYMPSASHAFGGMVSTPGDINQDGNVDIAVSVTDIASPSTVVLFGPVGGMSMAAGAASGDGVEGVIEVATLGYEEEVVFLDCESIDCESY